MIAGKEPASKLVRLACERHFRDLEEGRDRGLRFDRRAAERVLTFFGFLRHSKGEWAGQPFVLSPWQEFLVWTIFGWKRADGLRRFRTAYTEIARKNGKSTLAAGVGLYLLFGDDEPGAEVYSAATKREQARIVFDEAKRMVLASGGLRRHIQPVYGSLTVQKTHSRFLPLASEEDSLDGLNVHGALIDELHAHRTRGVYDVLDTATGARRQPLVFTITTAGFDRTSVCWELHDYAQKVLEATVEDDSFFAFVAGIDEADDWTDESAWAKANPNLGVSVKLDDLRRKAAKAQHLPAAQNAFRRLHLNEWTQQDERWLDLALWDEQPPIEEAVLEGRTCYAGIDLSSTTDISALVLVFPLDDGSFAALARFYVPGHELRQRATKDRIDYPALVRSGHLVATEGDIIDYDRVRADVNELGTRYRIREIAIDRWNATQLTTQLDGDGFTMVPFGQGFASMAAPTKALQEILVARRLRHGGQPLLRWMAGNVAVRQDPAGNLKPDKAKSTGRIDGIVALIMGLGRAQLHRPRAYESRGVLTV